jgi:hypothetical protein
VKRLGKTFKIEDQGNLSDYLGIKIERKPDGTLEWTQPTLTQSILKDLKLDGEKIKGRQTKHLNIKYHHFREEVRKGTISLYHTRTED